MSTDFTTLRQLVYRGMGDYKAGTTSGAGSGSTLVDSKLADRPNDYYNDQFVLVTAGTIANERRKIQDFIAASGVVTPYVNFSAASGSAVAYQIHRYDPDEMDAFIKQACRQSYPPLHKHLLDKTLVGNNPLPNAHFEDGATTPTNWAVSNVTCARTSSAENFRGGSYSSGVTRASDGHLYISESQWPALLDLAGFNITWKCWVKSTVASQVRLQIYTKDVAAVEATSNGSYHTGGGEWELLKVENVAIPTNLVDIEFRIRAEGSNTIFYADNTYVFGALTSRYLLPAQWNRDPRRIYMQTTWQPSSVSTYVGADSVDEVGKWYELFDWRIVNDGTNKFIENLHVPEGRKIIIEGEVYLSQPSAESDTVEVDEPESKALAALAKFLMYDALIDRAGSEDKERVSQKRTDAWGEWLALRPRRLTSVPIRA